MSNQELKKNIKSLIADGKTKEVFPILLKITEGDQQNEVLLLQAKFKQLERDKRLETASRDEIQLDYARLRDSLLKVVDVVIPDISKPNKREVSFFRKLEMGDFKKFSKYDYIRVFVLVWSFFFVVGLITGKVRSMMLASKFKLETESIEGRMALNVYIELYPLLKRFDEEWGLFKQPEQELAIALKKHFEKKRKRCRSKELSFLFDNVYTLFPDGVKCDTDTNEIKKFHKIYEIRSSKFTGSDAALPAIATIPLIELTKNANVISQMMKTNPGGTYALLTVASLLGFAPGYIITGDVCLIIDDTLPSYQRTLRNPNFWCSIHPKFIGIIKGIVGKPDVSSSMN